MSRLQSLPKRKSYTLSARPPWCSIRIQRLLPEELISGTRGAGSGRPAPDRATHIRPTRWIVATTSSRALGPCTRKSACRQASRSGMLVRNTHRLSALMKTVSSEFDAFVGKRFAE